MERNDRQRTAAAQQAALSRQQEFMSLAKGVGLIPEEYRNRAYEKLEYGPGEGGFGMPALGRTQSTGGLQMTEFLAAIASGADPERFAQQLLAGDTPTTTATVRRSRAKENA